MNTPTTDQRERALADPMLHDDLSQWAHDHKETILAALTAPPHVPQEIVDKLRHWKNHNEELKAGAETMTARSYYEGGLQAYKNVIALLTQGREK
jgi:hypothetical protein